MNIKIFFALLVFSFSFLSNSEAQKNTIEGTLEFKEPVKEITFGYWVAGKYRADTTELVNGKFNFSREINEPTWGTMIVYFESTDGEKARRRETLSLIIEPGLVTVHAKDSLSLAKVNGSKTQKVFDDYRKLRRTYDIAEQAITNKLRDFQKEKDEAAIKKTKEELSSFKKGAEQVLLVDYLKNNPKSPIAFFVLFLYFDRVIDVEKSEPIFEGLDKIIQSSASGINFRAKIEYQKNLEVGAYAMDFTQNDTLDNPVSLSDFKGQYVLLDFWASWCVPCRAENPNIVAAFNKYKDKNFTVFGVSLDQPGKKQSWLNAIKKDNLTWTHVSDLKFWNNDVAKQYNIRSVPMNFLIDPKGKIIAKNIRGEELTKTLAAFIK